MRFLISFLLMLSFSTYATSDVLNFEDALKVEDEEKTSLYKAEKEFVESFLILANNQQLEESETCLDEMQKRKMQIIYGNIAMPAIGVGQWYVQVFAMAGLFNIIYPSTYGWAALGGAITGMMTGAATYVGLQTYKIIQLINHIKLQKIVTQARIGSGKALHTFSERVLNKAQLAVNPENLELVKNLLSDLDKTGQLCNASLKSEYRQRRFVINGKLKNAVASKREVFKYLVDAL